MDIIGSSKILKEHMALFQEMLATPPPAVKQKKRRTQTLCNDA